MILFSLLHLYLHHLSPWMILLLGMPTNSTPSDSSPSLATDLVDLRKTKQYEYKKGDDISQPSTVEQVDKPITPFSNRLRNKDQTNIDKIRGTFS